MRRPPRLPPGEVALAIIEIDQALAGITASLHDVVSAVSFNVANRDGRGARRVFKRATIEMQLAVIQADIAWHYAVGDHDVGKIPFDFRALYPHFVCARCPSGDQ